MSSGESEWITMLGMLSVIFFRLFWIWMLIDCAVNEPSVSGKIVWIVIIFYMSCFGALLYYFVRRKGRIAGSGG